MIKRYLTSAALLPAILATFFTNTLFAQQSDQALKAIIIRQDSLFWQAYNSCNTAAYKDFFSEDVEFYHDKGGVTMGLPALVASAQKNLCSETGAFRLRREAVSGSYEVFLLKKDDVAYGAILSGAHVFYILEKGKPDRLDGLAKFTHLWMLKDGAWKMTRVLSYDHGPAPYQNKRTAIAVPAATLQAYAGKYKGPQIGTLSIEPGDKLLRMQIGDKSFLLYPEKENLFFSKDRDLTFEFIKSGSNTKLIVRENGNIAEELTSTK